MSSPQEVFLLWDDYEYRFIGEPSEDHDVIIKRAKDLLVTVSDVTNEIVTKERKLYILTYKKSSLVASPTNSVMLVGDKKNKN